VVVGVLVRIGGWRGWFPPVTGWRSQSRGVMGVLRALSAEVAGLAAAEAFIEHSQVNPHVRVNNGWGGTSSPTFGLRPGRVLGGPGTLGSVQESPIPGKAGCARRIGTWYLILGMVFKLSACLS
jgi:hypothetical protein